MPYFSPGISPAVVQAYLTKTELPPDPLRGGGGGVRGGPPGPPPGSGPARGPEGGGSALHIPRLGEPCLIASVDPSPAGPGLGPLRDSPVDRAGRRSRSVIGNRTGG